MSTIDVSDFATKYRRQLETLLDELVQLDVQGYFAEPVPLDVAPGYLDVVEVPMDFSTMRTKLKNGVYSDWSSFKRDFETICKNAMKYNASKSRIHKAASTLLRRGRKVCQQHLTHHLPDLISQDPSYKPPPAPSQVQSPMLLGSAINVQDFQPEKPRTRASRGIVRPNHMVVGESQLGMTGHRPRASPVEGSMTNVTAITHGFIFGITNPAVTPPASRQARRSDPSSLEDENYLSSEYSETDDEDGSESKTNDRAQDKSRDLIVNAIRAEPSAYAEGLRYELLISQLLHLRGHYLNVERYGALPKVNRLPEMETGARTSPYKGRKFSPVKRRRIASSLVPIYDEVRIIKEIKRQQEIRSRDATIIDSNRRGCEKTRLILQESPNTTDKIEESIENVFSKIRNLNNEADSLLHQLHVKRPVRSANLPSAAPVDPQDGAETPVATG